MDERHPPPPARAPLPEGWWNLPLRTRRIIAAGVAAMFVATVAIGAVVVRDDGHIDPAAFVTALPPERIELWDALAECESEGRWDLDAGNGYFGGLQFALVPWAGVGGEGSPAEASREEQIMRAEMLHDLQGWDAWPRCSARLGLG